MFEFKAQSMNEKSLTLTRRSFLATGIATASLPALKRTGLAQESDSATTRVITPPTGKGILLSCKLSMITREVDGKKLSAAERLRLAGQAGFDGVDFDQAAEFTPAQARSAVQESGVFVHNAINHAHWRQRLTSA